MKSPSTNEIEVVTVEEKNTPWRRALEFPSANQMRHFRSFMEGIGWWRLEPDFGDGRFFRADPALKGASVAAADGPRLAVVYVFDRTSRATGSFVGLAANANYSVKLFNPRTGERRNLGVKTSDGEGSIPLPERPDREDWVFFCKASVRLDISGETARQTVIAEGGRTLPGGYQGHPTDVATASAEQEPLVHEADVFGGLPASVVCRLRLWPDLAPGETNDVRGSYVFDGKKQVWRIGALTSPEVVLLKPRNPRSSTLVLGIPGGGYVSQNLGSFCRNARPILESGRWLAVLHHRIPRRPGRPIYAAPQEDGKRAIRLLRAQAARFGYDPERIGAFGFSAGGNLTALLATSSRDQIYLRMDAADDLPARLNFAVPVYPAYVLEDGETSPNRDRGVDAKILPHFKIDADTPPMFFLHGDDDCYSPMASVRLYEELHRRKIPAQLFVFAHAQHGLSDKVNARGWQIRVVDWLEEMGF